MMLLTDIKTKRFHLSTRKFDTTRVYHRPFQRGLYFPEMYSRIKVMSEKDKQPARSGAYHYILQKIANG